MADINSKFDIGVTTGPIRGSRKVHVGAQSGSGVRVAMREIDLEGGEVVVTDYKTGSVKESELALKGDWLERLAQGKSSKALQLLIYSAIALETLGADGGSLASVQSGIRSGKNAREGLLKLKIDGRDRITGEDAHQLLGWLVDQLEALHGSQHGLEHESEARFCAYCAVLDPVPTYFN